MDSQQEKKPAMDSCHLPEEVVILILERLPLASAIRFRIICKSWRSIISAPDFLNRSILVRSQKRESSLAVIKPNGNMLVGFCLDAELRSPTLSQPTKFSPPPSPGRSVRDYPTLLMGSCKGIVCLSEPTSGWCALWNPTTGESRVLAGHDDSGSGSAPFYFGIGYHGAELKVVKIYGETFEGRIRCGAWIYELSSDSWRKIGTGGIDDVTLLPWRHYPHPHGKVAFSQDGVGWTCSWMNYSDSIRIVSFDMANEGFTVFDSPTGLLSYFSGNYDLSLHVLNDLLALCGCPSGLQRSTVHIWVLLRHGLPESWTKLWTIPLAPEEFLPMELWNGDLVLKRKSDHLLLLCDLSSSTVKTLPVAVARSSVVAFEKTHASLTVTARES